MGKFTKNRLLIPALSGLCVAMCVSVGFATWITTGGGSGNVFGTINADGIETTANPQDLDVVTITSLNQFSYATGYGFDNNGIFENNTYLTGVCAFNVTNGKSCFTSFRNNKSFKLDVELSTSSSFGGFASKSITSDSISLTSDNFTNVNQDPNDSAAISTTFTITCDSDTANFSFNFSIHLIWGGSNLSSFPDLSSVAMNIKFTPKENA